MFYETIINKKDVEEIIKSINSNKKKFVNIHDKTFTYGGFQTKNIIDLFNKKIRKKILENNCLYQDLFHLHYIEYEEGCHQGAHKHDASEVYSCILYLTNCTGDTVFENKKRVKPKKGKLVIFDSTLKHWGEKSVGKKVLVGAINKKIGSQNEV